MAVGIQVTKGDVNNQAGSIARSVFNVFQSVSQFKAWLDGTLDADLVTMGFTSGEVAILKSAFADLGALGAVFAGGAPGAQKDYRAFSKQLLGTGIY